MTEKATIFEDYLEGATCLKRKKENHASQWISYQQGPGGTSTLQIAGMPD